MEKFAVDLDKVLDEFEFNEDCAEQVASSVDSDDTIASTLMKRNLQASNIAQSSHNLEHLEVKPSNIAPSRVDEAFAIRKTETHRENTDSINDFYNRGKSVDSKVQQKHYADFRDGEPVPLTFHNDISQKLVQKRQNETSAGGIKNQNSYDKKLNQPNIKPSVSNVFSSLNDYINAPTGVESSVDLHSKTDNTVAAISKDSHLEAENSSEDSSEEIVNTETLLNTQTTRYQNILLPVKLDKNATVAKSEFREKRNLPESNDFSGPVVGIGGNSGISLNSGGISVISGGVTVTSGPINVNSGVSVNSGTISINPGPSKISEPSFPSKASNSSESISKTSTKVEHVYENVYIPTEVENLPEIYPAGKFHSESAEKKHVYENVDFDDKDGTYECIYVGKDKNTLETSTDHDYVAKIGVVAESEASTSENAGNFQSSTANAPVTERKPVIGFSTIDDLSEEELNKYLADLEAEERANEGKALYENVPYAEPQREEPIVRHVAGTSSRTLVEDEDANEAPIFETVTIGELPSVSEERLQEKAKKFPVIDYSKQQGTSASGSGAVADAKTSESSFLEKKRLEKVHAAACATSEARIKEKRSKKLGAGSDTQIVHTEGNAESQTSADDEEDVERRLPAVNSISSDEFEDDLSHNFNHVLEEEVVAKDDEFKTAEMHGDSLDNVNVEEKSNANADVSLVNNSADVEENTVESSKNDCTGREEQQVIVKTDNDDYSRDESATSALPTTSLENGIADDEEINVNSEEDVEDKPSRPQTLDIISTVSMDDTNTTIGSPGATPGTQERPETEGSAAEEPRDPSPDASDNSSMESGVILGKQPPFWIPDSEAPNCMLCDVKFNVIKRRHHCRACGKVLCNKCCSMKYRLEYQGNIDSRVCSPCYQLLVKAEQEHGSGDWSSSYLGNSTGNVNSPQGRQPNPNNPMEYCSTIPPLQQLAGGLPHPPTVMVPVGVLKREGSSKQRPEGQKSVMFSDGIRPGCDLTELDTSWDLKPPYRKIGNKRTPTPGQTSTSGPIKRQNMPPLDPNTNSYLPQDPDMLPPTVTIHKGQVSYHEVTDSSALYKSLKNDCEPPVMFAVNRNLYAYVKITNLNCCVNRICWNVTSRGLACVGQDEIILLVETLPDETQIPKDLLVHINQIYVEAIKGNTIVELGVSIHQGVNFLGSREHAGFLFIRQTFQCLQKIVIPPAPFLVGLLVHRWETPWAKVFPLRLVLRLGAEYRYYPCPLVSVRFRDAVYFEIGHTIMKVLADFRNFAYTLPGVRGLTIHMQDRTTDVLFPKNRYDQVIKGLNNSNDHVLAFASNFSVQADSHLVCIQTNTGDESSYQTQAINIHNKPRKVTGASFVVINGALKSSMGLSAKSSIVEDGLMVQIMPEKMEALKAALKNMQDFSIGCGLQGAPEPDETVNIKWVDNDVQFNLGVKSPIDGKAMDGVPSIRVHNGTDYMGTSRFIRWTEVFIIKSDDHPTGVHDPVDINKLSESIARATCAALVKLLDLLATAGLTKLGVRTTIHPDNVGYEAGSEGTRLPPIYMNSLDNELIQVLHKAAQSSQDTNTVLELIFHVLDD